jgi:hypothetical protein
MVSRARGRLQWTRAGWLPFALAFVCGAPSAGCAHGAPKARYRVRVHVESYPERPVAGATVFALGQDAGATGASGNLTLQIRGTEGERIPLAVSCPEGFRSPDKPAEAILHGLAGEGREAQYDFRCAPMTRSLAIVVRADHGPHLPVIVLGREVARTDESGAAHVLVQVPANDDVAVTLSTAEPGNHRLRPQNPSIAFTPSDKTDFKLFNVSFQLEPEKVRAAAARPMPLRLN